jgi:hypothetical protein
MRLVSSAPMTALVCVCAAALLGCGGSGSSAGTPITPASAATPASAEDAALLRESSLSYLGAFRLPSDAAGGDASLSGYSYGGAALAFNPANDSLYLVGHVYDQRVGEVSIPALVNSTELGDLNTATVRQGPTDITEGHLLDIGKDGSVYPEETGAMIGGLLPWRGRLVGSVFAYYDASFEAKLSHFSSGTDFAVSGDFDGMFRVGTENPGFVGGYMTPIPEAWRSRLGGSALTGNCCLPIISRSSFGPSASVFEPDDLGIKAPAPSTMLVGYPADHPTLGSWDNTEAVNLDFNMATSVTGIVFVDGTRSVLFFGRQGLGIPCYGVGTGDPSLDRLPVSPGSSEVYCHDPASDSKGTHAWPYASYVWAYDAEDLARVKAGQAQPWDLRPYATWALDLPFATEGKQILGAAYDPAKRRIYISQGGADPGDDGYFEGPIIHALQVGGD